MCSCVLRVRGENFDVDGFLADSSLKPCDVFRKGEITQRRTGRAWTVSGFQLDVGDAEMDVDGQTREAIAFLERNADELARLADYPGVADRRLDFCYACRLGTTVDDKECIVQCDYLPPELLRLAGTLGIGIELTLYPLPSGGE